MDSYHDDSHDDSHDGGESQAPSPFWITAFLDVAPDQAEVAVGFWRTLTGYDLSGVRGETGEFATLRPPDADAYLKVQRLGEGADRIHLDLHVGDARAAADRAISVGATEVADHGYVALRSPGGFPFCFVTEHAERRPVATRWPDGTGSLVDQVCLDIPADHWAPECAFWAEVIGWPLQPSGSPEFARLHRPDAHPLRLLLQRLDEPDGEVRAHLDWAATDRDTEIARHTALGARAIDHREGWTVLTDPVGRTYCITGRTPDR